MTTIGFIGLGIMGAPMAANLVRAGFDVVGYNRTAEKTEKLVAVGGRAACNVAEAVREAHIVVTVLPDSPDVQAVLTGAGGVFESASQGTLIIDFSTISPEVAKRLHADATARGLRLVDAPVSGGEIGAVEGSLSVMVGGAKDDFESALPIFEAVGKTVVHVGPPGAGQTVKAANQLMVAGHLELLAEALVFLEAYDVDPRAALPVLGGGLASSRVLELKGDTMIARSFQPGFRVDLHHKDLGIVTSAARAAGVAIPLGSLVAQLMGALRAQGDGSLDHSALLRGVQRLAGRSTEG